MTPSVDTLEKPMEVPATFKRRKGNQTPTLHIHNENPSAPSYYDEPIIAKDIDEWVSKPFPWQKLVYRDIFQRQADGSLQYKVVCLSVPRRNGKTEVILGTMIIFAIVFKAKVLYTAQIQSTADDIYARFMDMVERPGSRLRQYFPGIYRKSKVSEEVVQAYHPRTGHPLGTLEFLGRKGDKGRGITRDVMIIDEAQDYNTEQEERFGSINGSSEIGLTFMVGTPPPLASDPGAAASWRTTRAEAVSEKEVAWSSKTKRGTAWIEWGADSVKEKSDRDAWYRYNPSMGYLPPAALSEAWFENRPSSAEVFSVENLGYWSTQSKDRAIEISAFNKLALLEAELKKTIDPKDRYAIGIKESRDGEKDSIHIGIAWRVATGNISYLHVQTIYLDEPGWDQRMEKFLVSLIKSSSCVSVLIDGETAKATVQPMLTKNNIWNPRGSRIKQGRVVMASTTDVVRSCSSLMVAISAKRFNHANQQPLHVAVEDAAKRKIGESGFGFRPITPGVDVIPLEVAALALYGVETKAQIKVGDMSVDMSQLDAVLGAL